MARARLHGTKVCFACGNLLSKDHASADRKLTREHHIPKWLISRFNLWDQRISLANNTSIPYRQSYIPCCRACNNLYLNEEIEKPVEKAFAEGRSAVSSLPDATFYIWLTKIYFGHMYLHRRLPRDRRTQSSRLRPIMSSDRLRALQIHRMCLQRATSFAPEIPGSIYVFDLEDDESTPPFDIAIMHGLPIIAIVVGRVGVVSHLLDGGRLQTLENSFSAVRASVLSHRECLEFAALISALALSIEEPSFVTVGNGREQTVVSVPRLSEPPPLTLGRDAFVHMLAGFLRTPKAEITGADDSFACSLLRRFPAILRDGWVESDGH